MLPTQVTCHLFPSIVNVELMVTALADDAENLRVWAAPEFVAVAVHVGSAEKADA